MTTQKQIRRAFWQEHKAHFGHPSINKTSDGWQTDVRCAFVDFVDMLQKSGQISEALASRVTL